MTDILDRLHARRVLLMDGAMGTELLRAGVAAGDCLAACNLRQPDRVRAIHRAYRNAGAECLVTNTFQANPAALALFGLDAELENINHAGIALAREAVGTGAVLASLGWMDVNADPAGFTRVVRSLQNADALLLETWSGDFELAVRLALDHSANPGRKPLLLSLAFEMDGSGRGVPRLHSGESPQQVAERAAPLGVTALGVNCGRDIDVMDIAAILREFRATTDLPLFARPNAGTPTPTNTGLKYPRSPQAMAAAIPALIEVGASAIGGCCGTTPAHIAAFRRRLET